MNPAHVGGVVVAVSRDSAHGFSKPQQKAIRLLAGLGVEGDAHLGTLVQHLSRVKRDPTQPNLRQVHLIHAELFDELRPLGFEMGAGEMGENITTTGVPLLELPRGTRLRIGAAAVVELTGLRNPCAQLDRLRPGLMKATLDRDESGGLVRKAGVMGVVVTGGDVVPGDRIVLEMPSGEWQRLEPV